MTVSELGRKLDRAIFLHTVPIFGCVALMMVYRLALSLLDQEQLVWTFFPIFAVMIGGILYAHKRTLPPIYQLIIQLLETPGLQSIQLVLFKGLRVKQLPHAEDLHQRALQRLTEELRNGVYPRDWTRGEKRFLVGFARTASRLNNTIAEREFVSAMLDTAEQFLHSTELTTLRCLARKK